MMKVGILTFHNAINYGAVLQTYATQEILKSLGYEAEVIDYHNKAIDSAYRGFDFKLMPKRNPKRFIKYLIYSLRFRKRRKAFESFTSSYLNISNKQYKQGVDNSIKGYDDILIGSDQLWNTIITNGFDDIYWGNFEARTAKKIAWAVSMNYMHDSETDIERIKSFLTNFYAISVREESLKAWLEKITDKPVSVLLDPTLSLSVDIWSKITPSNNYGDYILSFSVEHQEEVYKTAKQLSKETGLKVIFLKAYSDHKIGTNILQHAGPLAFLSLIKNAKYVVTGSFHGTAFSIIFKKNFYSIMDKRTPNTRVTSLLSMIGISDRACGFNEIKPLSDIDYTKVDKILIEKRQEAMSFLKSSLK